MYFRFRQKFMNRQNAAARCIFFSLLKRVLPIDVSNQPALVGDARRTEKNPQNKIRCKFGPHCLLAQDASLRQY